MPNHVYNEVLLHGLDNLRMNEILAATCDRDGDPDFSILLPVPPNVWLGDVGVQHEKAFHKELCGLDWCRLHWGTKWNAYGSCKGAIINADALTLRFESAWRPPYGWLLAIFNKFCVSFDHNWLDEGATCAVHGVFNYVSPDEMTWRESTASPELHKQICLTWRPWRLEEEEP